MSSDNSFDVNSYKLIAEVFTQSPIRSLGISPSNHIMVGGEDSCLRQFSLLDESTGQIDVIDCIIQHDYWVTAVTSMEANLNHNYPEGIIVTGCRDSKIRIYKEKGDYINCLTGHENGIISFSWNENKTVLYSGSWDGTAGIWDINNCLLLHRIGPMENGVNVLYLKSGLLATTSTGEKVGDLPANFKLRLWDVNQSPPTKLNEIEDHQGPIRSIKSTANGDTLLTSSNDGSIKVRSIDGSCVGTVVHDPQLKDGILPFVFDCTALHLPSSSVRFVSIADDGSCEVWSDMNRVGSFTHPSCIWCVYALSNGDFITGSEDGILRIFSCNKIRQELTSADTLTDKLKEDTKAANSANDNKFDDDLTKYELWENNASCVGKGEGDIKIFNKGGVAIAAQWLAESGCWIEVGEVTGKAKKDSIAGVEYDVVLPVEIETVQGLQTLKLGYNNGENPFVAAQRFIDNNNLGQHYLSQIADWITQQTGASASAANTIDMSATAATSQVSGFNGVGDPTNMNNSNNVKRILPYEIFLSFEDVPATLNSKVLGKLLEFNSQLADENEYKLNGYDLTSVEVLVNTLANTSRYHSSVIDSQGVKSLLKCGYWQDAKMKFPFFDILRILLTHPNGMTVINKINTLQFCIDTAIGAISSSESCGNATALTGLRFLCNLFKADATIFPRMYDVIQGGVSQSNTGNKMVRAALAGLLLNCSILVKKSVGTGTDVERIRTTIANAAADLLKKENGITEVSKSNVDVLIRSGLAIGNLAVLDKCITCDTNISILFNAILESTNEHVKDISKEVLQLIN